MQKPESWIEVALRELRLTLAGKNEDYRIEGEFSNFEFAARVANIKVIDSIVNQLAIKLGRLQGVRDKKSVNNETVLDTFKDLAGYAVILYGYALSEGESVTFHMEDPKRIPTDTRKDDNS